jgi:hypothetical protein
MTENTNPNPFRKTEDLSNRTFIAKSIIWIAWVLIIFGIMVLYSFAYNTDRVKDHWGIDSVVIGVLVFLLPTSLALRFFVINKIQNLLLKITLYLIGLALSEFIILCGFFAVMSGDFLLLCVGAFMSLLYFPAFISIRTSKQ